MFEGWELVEELWMKGREKEEWFGIGGGGMRSDLRLGKKGENGLKVD